MKFNYTLFQESGHNGIKFAPTDKNEWWIHILGFFLPFIKDGVPFILRNIWEDEKEMILLDTLSYVENTDVLYVDGYSMGGYPACEYALMLQKKFKFDKVYLRLDGNFKWATKKGIERFKDLKIMNYKNGSDIVCSFYPWLKPVRKYTQIGHKKKWWQILKRIEDHKNYE